jgi:hypothetical protein
MSSPLIDDAICPEGKSSFCAQTNTCIDAQMEKCADAPTREDRFNYPECVRQTFETECKPYVGNAENAVCREGAMQGARPANVFPPDTLTWFSTFPAAYLQGYIGGTERCTSSRCN